MAESDRQCLIEDGGVELLPDVEQMPDGMQRAALLSRRPGLRAAVALAALGCVAGAALLAARHGGAARQAGAETLRQGGATELTLEPSQCSAYTDCAALPGDCCPTEAGVMMGCCSSPQLAAGTGLVGSGLDLGAAPPPAAAGECVDTPGWTNGYWKCGLRGYTSMQGCWPSGLSCKAYSLLGWCANGAAVPGKEWTVSAALHSPEENCCVCGKAPEPAAPTPAPAPPVPAPAPAAVPVAWTPTTVGPPTVLPPLHLPTAAPPAAVPAPTSAPLGGAAAPNGTQGEPAGAECAAAPGCKALGISGLCCPTADGTMLGCCGGDLGAGGPPPLLPAASGPGPLMTFYMYRVASDEDYPLNGVNTANLAGDMWYLHNEVVQSCPRKFNMERLIRLKVSARATPKLYGQNQRNFDAFVAFDQAKCTVPQCEERHWAPFGYVVGCQPNNKGQVAVPGTPAWYSLPGTCPNKFYYEKTEACNQAEPGGACPTAEVTGARNCTYHIERAGELRLDELSGLQDYNKVCQQTGVLEFDMDKDEGVGTKFWNGKTDAAAGQRRTQAVKDLFASKFPSMPADLEDPPCDV